MTFRFFYEGTESYFNEANRVNSSFGGASGVYQRLLAHETIFTVAIATGLDDQFGYVKVWNDEEINGPLLTWDHGKSLVLNVAFMNVREELGSSPSNRKVIADGKSVRGGSVLPPNICLAHELGHCIQFIDDPDRWINLEPKDVPQIEHENLVLHEWPICFHFGIASRKNYSNF
jgi:hypothetical protein